METRLFGSMEEDEDCEYDHALIDENCSVGEEISNVCKDVVIETESMQSRVENDSREGVELQSEPLHALDALSLGNYEMHSQSNVKIHYGFCKGKGVYNFQKYTY